MTTNPLPPLRLWRLRPWNANPLMRTADRCRAVVRLLAVTVVLLAVPIAGAAGTARYTATAERIRIENAGKVMVTATVLSEPTAILPPNPYRATRHEGEARWDQGGHRGSARVEMDEAAAVGTPIEVWLDADGAPTTAPRPPSNAVGDGIAAALVLLLLAVTGAVGLDALVGVLLNARSGARWDAELRNLGRAVGT